MREPCSTSARSTASCSIRARNGSPTSSARSRSGVETGALLGPEDTYSFLRDVLAHTEPEVAVEELLDTGTVIEVGDGIASVSGLRDVGSQELVEFSGGVYGIAFSLLGDRVGCILLGAESGIREGSDVVRTGHLLRVPVGEALMGRIVNALGQPIDGKGPIVPKGYMPVERKAPGVVERQPVDVPLHTGIKVIDALVPLGRGQRELIIGDRKIGKTTLAVDTILAQRGDGRELRLRRDRAEGLLGRARRFHARRAGGARTHDRRRRASQRAAGLPLHRAVRGVRHGRVLHGARQGRARGLRRPLEARGHLPRDVRIAQAAGRP